MHTDCDGPTTKLLELYGRHIKIASSQGFNNPAHLAYANHCIDPKEIQALKSALRLNFPIFQTFMSRDQVKFRKQFGSPEELSRPDLIAWPEAQNLVTQSFQEFSPRLGALTEYLFAQGYVHPIAGIASAGAVVQTCYRDMPEILIAFQGSLQDVRELSRTMGQATAVGLRNTSGLKPNNPSIFIDAVCAIFGEKIVLHPSSGVKKFMSGIHLTMAAEAVSDVIRYSMLEELQQSATELCIRDKCEPRDLDRAWGQILREHTGATIDREQGHPSWRDYNYLYQQPFMGIANLYAQLTSVKLWKEFEKNSQKFPHQYMTFMANTSSVAPHELLTRFGCDTKKPEFWNSAIVSVVSHYAAATRAVLNSASPSP